MSLDFSFPKKDRLNGNKLMRTVFDKGETTRSFPFLFYSMPLLSEREGVFKVAFGVSKKKTKKL